MQHRKKYHSEYVSVCNNFLNGNCEYPTCWFKHNEDEEFLIEKNDSKKLEDMIEKFSGRLTKIEGSMTKNSKMQENKYIEN